jgi:NAD(P)-dependent dehydrogenase (short-subunit alcohol dehydrogenase family)
LITGANSGIGKQTAIELAKHDPAQIWIAARNEQSGLEAVQDVKKTRPSVDVRFVSLDLTSFESIKAAAKIVLAEAAQLDLLMLNAGIMGGPPGVTAEGYELAFGTNHVGHALLFDMLAPLLIKTAETSATKPRVVSVSSRGHAFEVPPGGIAFSTLKSAQTDLSGVTRYTQSKLANVVYAREIARHHPSIISVAIHPEDVATQLFDKGVQGGGPEIEYLAREVAPRVGVSLEEGVKNGLWAMTSDDVQSGRYYEPVGVLGKGSALSRDRELGEKLWKWMQEELGNDVV